MKNRTVLQLCDLESNDQIFIKTERKDVLETMTKAEL